MNFGFSEEQESLRTAARRFLAAECPTAFVRQMMAHETAHSGELWAKLADLGWAGLTVPRELGGTGATFLDAAVILEETGAALLPGPLFATAMLGVPTIVAAGSRRQKVELLPRVARGEAIVTLAVSEGSADQHAAGIRLRATRDGRDFVLNGGKRSVPDAAVAQWIVVAARTSRSATDGITLFLVEADAPGITVTPTAGADLTRRSYRLSFRGVRVRPGRVLGHRDRGWTTLRRVLRSATAAISIETVGVAQRVLDRSIEYARNRTQFGRPIGSFQAIQHRCVDMLVAIENARSLAYYAAWAVDQDATGVDLAVAMAKAYCSDIGTRVTADAIQVHGGVGFTWDNDMHVYYRRALANAAAFGTAPLHREAVARELRL